MSKSVEQKGASVAPKLTPWFDGKVKPARPGMYQRQWLRGELRWSMWTGKHWGPTCTSKCMAAHFSTGQSALQEAPWRGLAKKPEAA